MPLPKHRVVIGLTFIFWLPRIWCREKIYPRIKPCIIDAYNKVTIFWNTSKYPSVKDLQPIWRILKAMIMMAFKDEKNVLLLTTGDAKDKGQRRSSSTISCELLSHGQHCMWQTNTLPVSNSRSLWLPMPAPESPRMKTQQNLHWSV